MATTKVRRGRRKPKEHEVQLRPLYEIYPSPENNDLYRPIFRDDPDIQELADSIRRLGLREPIIVTEDDYILSGHRRYVACRLAGLKEVPVRVESIRRDDDQEAFLARLLEYNRQRVKSFDEVLREEAVSTDPAKAWEHLNEYRRERLRRTKPDLSDFSGVRIEAESNRRRKRISKAKEPMLKAVKEIIEEREPFWPLSDRQIHYALLNDPPLRHARKPGLRYRNDRASYKDLCDLLTRARLTGLIPWEAIGDETRPTAIWNVNQNVQSFIRKELDKFLKNYWLDLMQSQPNHIEIVAEKLTVRSIVQTVAADYCIPVTIGRGYCSITPRYELVERFRASRKERLIVLILSDFDPDGENIAASFARSLEVDFMEHWMLGSVTCIKVALTADQAKGLDLPVQMEAKIGSSTYRKFVEKHGRGVAELEAIPPEELQEILRTAIENVIDREAFEHEQAREQQDAKLLQATQQTILKAFKELRLEELNE